MFINVIVRVRLSNPDYYCIYVFGNCGYCFPNLLDVFYSKILLLIPKNRSGGVVPPHHPPRALLPPHPLGVAPLTPHRGLCPLDPCWGSAPDPVGLRRLGAAAPRPLRNLTT